MADPKLPIIGWELGNGSNILVSDKGIRGVVIKNRSKSILIENNTVTVGSGFLMPNFAKTVASKGLAGCEFMGAIPGTIGGGVHENARFRHPDNFGAYLGLSATRESDLYVGQLVDQVTVLLPNNSVTEISNKECNFVYEGFYHYSFAFNDDVIIKVRLKLREDSVENINKRMNAYLRWRNRRRTSIGDTEFLQPTDAFTSARAQQPGEPSAGCVFFNVPNEHNHPTGRLIDLCGLKGKIIGDAQISPKHANYIVNLGHARADDVRKLMDLCKTEVYKKFKTELIAEIQFVGEW